MSLSDLAIIASQWLSGVCPLSQCADLDESSQVDIADIVIVFI